MNPFLQFMIALAVARNRRPKMTGVWDLGLDTGVSKTMKSTGKMNSPTRIWTSLISPLGTLIDRSANWIVTWVGLS